MLAGSVAKPGRHRSALCAHMGADHAASLVVPRMNVMGPQPCWQAIWLRAPYRRLAARLWRCRRRRTAASAVHLFDGRCATNVRLVGRLPDRHALRHNVRDLILVFLDLMVDLGAHAAGHGERYEVSDAVDNLGRFTRLIHENGHDVKDACEELEAVGAPDDLPVARVRADLLLVHEVDAGDAQREDWAAAPLQAEAARAAGETPLKVNAAAGPHVPLAADEIFDAVVVLVEDGLPHVACRETTWRANGRAKAAARLLAAGVLEADGEDVRVVHLVHESLVLPTARSLGLDLLRRRRRAEEAHRRAAGVGAGS
mmetsp:Transcript_23391/g.39967  ORF Transcript_23391/g.39967 Transcript_23391/m.39967 type:complete len:313 (-) Transcript_23391:40-978(-)